MGDVVTIDYKTLTEPAVYLYGGGSKTAEPFVAADYADGGACIQAALDAAVPGSRVYIPSFGPDDGVTTTGGNTVDNVWAAPNDLSTTDTEGIHIHGDGPGVTDRTDANGNGGGTSIVATDGTMTNLLEMTGGFLHVLHDVNLHANQNATTALKLGGGGKNDWQVSRCMIEDATGANIEAHDQNCWIHHNWIEYGGTGLDLQVPRYSWVHDNLFADNDTAITNSSEINQWWVRHNRFASTNKRIWNITSPLTDGRFESNIIVGGGESSPGSYNLVRFNAGSTNNYLNCAFLNNSFDGTVDNLPLNAFHHSNGTFNNCRFDNNVARRLSGVLFGGNIRSNGTVTIDGHGLNSGDPSAGGQWNGAGEEGIVVYDTSVARPYTDYQYVSGAWQSA